MLLGGRTDCEVCGEANDGKQAVLKAIDLNPDLIILDYSMPGMDGLHVAQEIYKAMPAPYSSCARCFRLAELEREAVKYGVKQVISKAEMSKALVAAIEDFRPSANSIS